MNRILASSTIVSCPLCNRKKSTADSNERAHNNNNTNWTKRMLMIMTAAIRTILHLTHRQWQTHSLNYVGAFFFEIKSHALPPSRFLSIVVKNVQKQKQWNTKLFSTNIIFFTGKTKIAHAICHFYSSGLTLHFSFSFSLQSALNETKIPIKIVFFICFSIESHKTHYWYWDGTPDDRTRKDLLMYTQN